LNEPEKLHDVAALTEAASAALDGWLPAKIAASSIRAATVGVVGPGGLTWSRGFGSIDGGETRFVDEETLFCVRSLSKAITALGVLLAVQEGLVELDAPITEYLPGFMIQTRYEPNPERRVTLRHLLANRAGFTHDEPPGNDPAGPASFEKRVAAISRTWLRFPVGLRYAYSNLHFDLAGFILQEVSGDPFPTYMKERVFEPLGMRASTFDWSEAAARPNLARGYDPGGAIEGVAIAEAPAAGLYSTVRDLSEYLRFHIHDGSVVGRQLLRKNLMEEYRTVQFLESGQEAGYCFGIFWQPVSSTHSLLHSGGGHGYQSQMIVYPELSFGVTFLTNKDGHGLTVGPLQKVVDDVVRDRLGPDPVAEAPTEGMEELAPDDERVRAVLGRYWEMGDWTLELIDGVPTLATDSEPPVPVTFYERGEELLGVCGESGLLRFAYPKACHPSMLLWSDRRLRNVVYRMRNGGPADPPGPAKPEWDAYCGTYDILWKDVPCDDVRIHVRNGYLWFDDRRCIEHEPGLFFTCDGEAIDFRSSPQTAANLILRRQRG